MNEYKNVKSDIYQSTVPEIAKSKVSNNKLTENKEYTL